MLKILCLLLSILTWPCQAEDISILELHHRLPEQVLPTLEPLIAPGGSIVGANNQLFVRTTAENLVEIKKVLSRIDTPLRRLLISVRQDGASRQQLRERLLQQGQIQIGSSNRIQLQGSIQNQQNDNSSQTTQQIQTLEGAEAQIYLGRSLPVAMRQVTMTRGQTVVTDAVQYVDIGTGFTAQPRLAGNQVILTITPSQQELQGQQIHQSALNTTISGNLGEWISLGGSSQGSNRQQQNLIGGDSEQNSQQQQVWLKVDALE